MGAGEVLVDRTYEPVIFRKPAQLSSRFELTRRILSL